MKVVLVVVLVVVFNLFSNFPAIAIIDVAAVAITTVHGKEVLKGREEQ